MKKILKFIFYSKYTPVISWAVIIVFLLCFYLIFMPMAAPSWPTSPLKKIMEALVLIFTIFWPIYCIVLSIIFLTKGKHKAFALSGIFMNAVWLIFLFSMMVMGISV